MTAEQFTAFLANLSVGTFLNKTAYAGLTVEQQAAYDVKASQVAIAFRTKNPNGLTVHFPIDNINTTEKGVAIVVHPMPAPTKNKVFQYAGGYVLNMTKKAGLPDVATLNLIHASSIDDNFLKTTFVVAIKGEQYTNRATGEVKSYESTTLRNVDDAIELGGDAKGMLKEVAMAELRNAIRGASKAAPVNRNRIAVDDEPVEEHIDEPVAEEQL
jgi:hypothetical protein